MWFGRASSHPGLQSDRPTVQHEPAIARVDGLGILLRWVNPGLEHLEHKEICICSPSGCRSPGVRDCRNIRFDPIFLGETRGYKPSDSRPPRSSAGRRCLLSALAAYRKSTAGSRLGKSQGKIGFALIRSTPNASNGLLRLMGSCIPPRRARCARSPRLRRRTTPELKMGRSP